MSAIFQSAKFWWPGAWRAIILCVLAYWVAFDSSFDQLVGKLTTEDTAKWGSIEWLKFIYLLFGKPVIAALIALKGFLDDTMQKLRQEHTNTWKKGSITV